MSLTKLLAPVLMLSALALAGCNNPLAGPSELDVEAKAMKLTRETIKGGYELVSTEELKKWVDAGKDMLIVDTMPFEDSYKKNHIPGARHFQFPIPDMNEWNMAETGDKSQQDFETLLGADKNKTIVFYCGFVKCARSHNGAVWAKKLGYTKVYRMPGGIVAWKEAKFPIDVVK